MGGITAFAFPVVSPNPSDEAFIRRCVELARRAVGQTRPNPPVGCVLTTPAGVTLGEGFHRRAGLPHAEVNALEDAKRRGHSPRGATAYVSLEPCNHYGRTPPCAEALVKAGVGRVVVGMVDPDPRTSGGGIERLRRNGVEVVVDVQRDLCAKLLEGFESRVIRKRPFGHLKWAMTLDGKIATETGSSRWVTGEAARRHVHAVRAGMDAIIVGGATVRNDDPRLTVRGVDRGLDANSLAPIRVVVTRELNLPTERALWDISEAQTVVFTASIAGKERFADELRERGVDVRHVPEMTMDDVMTHLYDLGCLNVLWECGGGLAAQAISAGAVQKVMAFVAPKIIGGASAPSPVGSPPVDFDMAKAIYLSDRQVEMFDNGDILLTGYLP